MPFQVRNVMFDTIDTKGMRAGGLKLAEVVVEVIGPTAGEDLTIEYPAFGGAPPVVAEGVDWADQATDAENAYAMSVAVNRRSDLSVIAVYDRAAPTQFKLKARTQGTWAEQILVTSSNVAAITVGGLVAANLSGATYNTDGLGPQAFQAWLDANLPVIGIAPGERIDGSLIIEPLTTESSSFLVVWEENP